LKDDDLTISSIPVNSDNPAEKPRYRTNLLDFDIEKAYYDLQSPDIYFIIAKAEYRHEFLTHPANETFDKFDIQSILEDTVNSVLLWIPFAFRDYLFGLEIDVVKQSFCKKYEILRGHSIASLFLSYPKLLQENLKLHEVPSHSFENQSMM